MATKPSFETIESIIRRTVDLSSYVKTINKDHQAEIAKERIANFDDFEMEISMSHKHSTRKAIYLALFFKLPMVSSDDRRQLDVTVRYGDNQLQSFTKKACDFIGGYGWSEFMDLKTLRANPVLHFEIRITHDVSFERPPIHKLPSLLDQHRKQYFLCIKSGDIKLRVVTPLEDDNVHSPPKKRRKLNRKCKKACSIDDDDEKNVVKVSSCILRAASPVFEQMMESEMRESQEKEIEIRLKHVADVYHLVYFMCTDELRATADPLTLISVAHMYQMDRMFWQCAEKMSKTVTIWNFVETVNTLNKYDIAQGIPLVVAFGKNNIEKLKKRSDFCNLSCAFRWMILGVSADGDDK